MENLYYALGLTLFAGLATGIGSIIAFTAKRTNHRFLSVSTGFSAGVMLYVSFVEIFYKGQNALISIYGDYLGSWINIISFFAGILFIGIIDNLIPASGNPHETHPEHEMKLVQFKQKNDLKEVIPEKADFQGHSHSKLMRMGLFTALAITIHNFPEGLATFLSALQDPKLGLAIAIAVALHNIPEGISVSVPIYFATGNRKKAFFYSLFSGLAEPFGALIAYIAIFFWLGGEFGVVPPHLLGILFAGVAGIMVYISLDELLPTSRAYSKGHDSLFGLIGGMLIMSISLVMMK